MSLTSLLEHHAERYPDRSALEYEGAVTTWGELLEETRRTAGALHELGVRPGDVVGVLLHNSARFIEIMHAIAHLGAIFMPINWRLAGAEIAYITGHSGAAVLVSEAELEPLVEPVKAQLTCKLLRAYGAAGDGWESLDALRERAVPIAEPAEVGARRRAPADVHVRHDLAPEGRDDHLRQPLRQERRPHRRARDDGERGRPGLRSALPRRRPRPDDLDDDVPGRAHVHHAALRRRRRPRGDRAAPRQPRVAGAR